MGACWKGGFCYVRIRRRRPQSALAYLSSPPSAAPQKGGEALKAWVAGLERTHKIVLEVVKKQPPGFTLLKRQWVIERTFASLSNYRIHSKDYEVLPSNSEAFIYIAMIHLILRRLA